MYSAARTFPYTTTSRLLHAQHNRGLFWTREIDAPLFSFSHRGLYIHFHIPLRVYVVALVSAITRVSLYHVLADVCGLSVCKNVLYTNSARVYNANIPTFHFGIRWCVWTTYRWGLHCAREVVFHSNIWTVNVAFIDVKRRGIGCAAMFVNRWQKGFLFQLSKPKWLEAFFDGLFFAFSFYFCFLSFRFNW